MDVENIFVGCSLEVFAPPNSPVPLCNPDIGLEQDLGKIKYAKVYPEVGYHGNVVESVRSGDEIQRIAEYFCVAYGSKTVDNKSNGKGDFDNLVSGRLIGEDDQITLNNIIEATVNQTLFGKVTSKPPVPHRSTKAAKIHPMSSLENLASPPSQENHNSQNRQAHIAAMFCTESPKEAALRRRQDSHHSDEKQHDNNKKSGNKKSSKKNAIWRFLERLRKFITRK